MKEVLQYLKEYGDRLDSEIAAATGISLAKVRLQISELAANGKVMSCLSTRFEKGKKIEGVRCRLVGYIHPAPGSRPKALLRLP
jgi:hypothetical protein